jgi:hypothetical protein
MLWTLEIDCRKVASRICLKFVSIITAPRLNSFWITNLSLLSESQTGLWSLEFSIWISESRIELTSCGPNRDHQVEQLILLCYIRCHENM